MKRIAALGLPLAIAAGMLLSAGPAGVEGCRFPFQDTGLGPEERVADLVARMTLEEKIGQMMHTAPAIPRLGVPEYSWWSEALHGVARSGEAVTVFPQAIALAATFDPDAVERLGDITATEARAIFNEDRRQGRAARMYRGLTVWTPNINIFRDPRWGRGQETYGEDPLLTARMGLAMVRGLQGRDPRYLKLSACAKHFAVHSGPESQRHRIDVLPSAYDLWDTYLPAFRELVVSGGVSGVMCAYNRFRSQPCCGSDLLMTDILRRQWGFSGYVTSDCWALDDFVKEHKTHVDDRAAAIDALLHGVDLECGGAYGKPASEARPGVFGALLAAVRSGAIAEAATDRSLRRLFTVRFRLGLFDPPEMVEYARIPYSALNSPEHRAHALRAARESVVLLKNDSHVLPLAARRIRRIAVLGPNADDRLAPLGNYNGVPARLVTPREGIARRLSGQADVIYAKGVNWLTAAGDGNAWRQLAGKLKRADVIVFVGGISPALEGEEGDASSGDPMGFFRGDRTTIALPAIQTAFLKRLKKLGKPLVLVVMSGSAIALEWEAAHVDAIIQSWYGGQACGEALADVLFGDYNPAGRLPVTFYRRDGDLPPFTDYSMENRTYRYFRGRPLFPFGHGLSYTRFDYGGLSVTPEAATGQTIAVSAWVRNCGPREGDEVVQLYLSHPGAAAPAPLRSLQGFRRLHLRAGESRRVDFQLAPRNLALVDAAGELAQGAGTIVIDVGGGQPGYAATVSARVRITGERYIIH
jgi:beta-glucosidase